VDESLHGLLAPLSAFCTRLACRQVFSAKPFLDHLRASIIASFEMRGNPSHVGNETGLTFRPDFYPFVQLLRQVIVSSMKNAACAPLPVEPAGDEGATDSVSFLFVHESTTNSFP